MQSIDVIPVSPVTVLSEILTMIVELLAIMIAGKRNLAPLFETFQVQLALFIRQQLYNREKWQKFMGKYLRVSNYRNRTAKTPKLVFSKEGTAKPQR